MADNDNRNRCNTWVAGAGFGFLTLNSGLAIYRAKADLASILFVSGSYITLLLLFACLRAYERAPAMERARRAVWPLTTLLTPGFAWKVPAVMPWAVAAAVVWGMAAATTAGGFFALFLFVTVFNLALVLLFACLRAYERAPRGSPASERARRAVWSLTTLLTWKVAAFLPWAVPAAVVGSPAAIATAAGGFFALLLFACLCAYERAPVGSPAMERARRAVWLLTPPPRAGGGRPNEMHQVAAALVMAAFALRHHGLRRGTRHPRRARRPGLLSVRVPRTRRVPGANLPLPQRVRSRRPCARGRAQTGSRRRRCGR
ncbi:unnamed protein product [Urochloa humidicola]